LNQITNLSSLIDLPRIEKKIMNPADICTTLLLPTRVKAKRPAFSLLRKQIKITIVHYINKEEVFDCS
jgi:hypothetical protein